VTTKATPRPVSTKPFTAIVNRWLPGSAVIELGYPEGHNQMLRFGYTAEVTVRTNDPLLGADVPEVRVSQASIMATSPADAKTRAEVYMLACEVGAVVLRLLEEGKPMSEALAQVAEGARFDNVDWKLKL
jgi:hypothetical protein